MDSTEQKVQLQHLQQLQIYNILIIRILSMFSFVVIPTTCNNIQLQIFQKLQIIMKTIRKLQILFFSCLIINFLHKNVVCSCCRNTLCAPEKTKNYFYD